MHNRHSCVHRHLADRALVVTRSYESSFYVDLRSKVLQGLLSVSPPFSTRLAVHSRHDLQIRAPRVVVSKTQPLASPVVTVEVLVGATSKTLIVPPNFSSLSLVRRLFPLPGKRGSAIFGLFGKEFPNPFALKFIRENYVEVETILSWRLRIQETRNEGVRFVA
ncbi:hypothetical protein GQ457_12G012030 [Hibiscus cannabinus]